MSVKGDIRRIQASSQAFASLAANLDGVEDIERLVDGYLEMRRVLASSFRDLTLEGLDLDLGALAQVRSVVSLRMAETYGAQVHDHLLGVKGYGGVREVLYAYLLMHADSPVSGSRLRVLTADQIHTERRVRELRDLGIDVQPERLAGEDHYTLRPSAFDGDAGAKYQIRKNIKEATSLRSAERVQLVEVVDRIDGSGGL